MPCQFSHTVEFHLKPWLTLLLTLILCVNHNSRDRAEGGAGGALAPPTFLQE